MSKVRLVADTNVVILAFLWGGKPRHIIDLGIDQLLTLVTSEALLNELADVLSRHKHESRLMQIGISVEDLLTSYRRFCEMAPQTEIHPTVLKDSDDDTVLACALGGGADYIVTGDAHLLNLKRYHAIPILTISEFLALLESPNATTL